MTSRQLPTLRRPAAALGSLALAISGTFAVSGTVTSPAVAAQEAPAAEQVTFTKWDFAHNNPGGTYDGTRRVTGDKPHALRLWHPTDTRSYTDPFADAPAARTYDEGTWVSPEVPTPFGLDELVSSWNAHTPGGSWVEVSVQGTAENGTTSSWYVLGRWADDDNAFHPTSVPGQRDELARVSIDTLVTRNDHRFDDYRIKVALMRPTGTTVSPSVSMVGAMASYVPSGPAVAPPTTMTRDTVLDVPTYSQELHRGDFPEYDNGGEAWCSPTSTSMVVAYWGKSPEAQDYAYVTDRYGAEHTDPWVDYAARHTFDYNYDGAGNWPFNTAYAARLGLEGFVTRLHDLNEAEQFIKAGIPLVASVSFKKDELDGAGYSTGGHLMTIVGFTKEGDVVVNDPASHLIPSDDQVRVTYDRQQFTNAWIGHTGGIVYVIHPRDVRLPRPNQAANW
ncbi:MAG TPA: peptidase C39 family protein [Nocardioidaceae bacterium]|nr:peptidase C39 family protein [Nocardioidaceae bacterium]